MAVWFASFEDFRDLHVNYDELYLACCKGDYVKAHTLLHLHAEVDFKKAIWVTLRHGYIKIAELLLEHGATLPEDSLHIVAAGPNQETQIPMLQWLFRRGFSPLKRSKAMMTPLEELIIHISVPEPQNAKKVATLLLQGMNSSEIMNEWSCWGNAVRLAAGHDCVKILDVLLKFSPKEYCHAVAAACHRALRSRTGSKEMCTLLIEKCAQTKKGRRLLLPAVAAAARVGNVEILQVLLSHGAVVNGRGCSPLKEAVRSGEACSFMLLEAGAHARPALGHCYDDKVARALLRRAAEQMEEKWEEDGPHGWREDGIMHCVVQWGDMELARQFLRLGYSLMARNHNNETPLHYAMEVGQMEMCKLFVLAGGDILATKEKKRFCHHYAKEYYTPLDMAQSSSPELYKFMLEHQLLPLQLLAAKAVASQAKEIHMLPWELRRLVYRFRSFPKK